MTTQSAHTQPTSPQAANPESAEVTSPAPLTACGTSTPEPYRSPHTLLTVAATLSWLEDHQEADEMHADRRIAGELRGFIEANAARFLDYLAANDARRAAERDSCRSAVCAKCGGAACTNENHEVCGGAQLTGGRWACCEQCWGALADNEVPEP